MEFADLTEEYMGRLFSGDSSLSIDVLMQPLPTEATANETAATAPANDPAPAQDARSNG